MRHVPNSQAIGLKKTHKGKHSHKHGHKKHHWDLINYLKLYTDNHKKLINLINIKKALEIEHKFSLYNISDILERKQITHEEICDRKKEEHTLYYKLQSIFDNFEAEHTLQFKKLKNVFKNYQEVHMHISVLPYEYLDHKYTIVFINSAEDYIK